MGSCQGEGQRPRPEMCISRQGSAAGAGEWRDSGVQRSGRWTGLCAWSELRAQGKTPDFPF